MCMHVWYKQKDRAMIKEVCIMVKKGQQVKW